MTADEIIIVRRQNDNLRSNGPYSLDKSVIEIEDLAELFKHIRYYNGFDDEADSEDEHDFGSIVWGGLKVSWTIEYVHPLYEHLHDPLDPECESILRVFVDQGDRRK